MFAVPTAGQTGRRAGMSPAMSTQSKTPLIASQAAASGFSFSPWPSHGGGTLRTALSVTRTNSNSTIRLILLVSGKRPDVPLAERHKLPAPEVEVLKKWIDAGANWPEAGRTAE
jgi:hypothetical protein